MPLFTFDFTMIVPSLFIFCRDPLSETDSDSFTENIKKKNNNDKEKEYDEDEDRPEHLDQDPLDQSFEEETNKKKNFVC